MNSKYSLLDKLSNGAFSNVYKIKDLKTNKLYAVKIDNSELLKHEAYIYKKLRSIYNIPKVQDFFIYENKYFLVLDLLSFNLIYFKYKTYNSNKYNIKVKEYIKKLIDILSYIHDLGIVHRDIKPNNICFDRNLNIYLIDFGLSKEIIVNSKHISEKKISNIIGSYNFCSINVINLIEPSRRDDIESLFFIYLFLILSENNYKSFDLIDNNDKKNITIIEDILKDYPDKNLIINLFKYIRKISFFQKPNYKFINQCI